MKAETPSQPAAGEGEGEGGRAPDLVDSVAASVLQMNDFGGGAAASHADPLSALLHGIRLQLASKEVQLTSAAAEAKEWRGRAEEAERPVQKRSEDGLTSRGLLR